MIGGGRRVRVKRGSERLAKDALQLSRPPPTFAPRPFALQDFNVFDSAGSLAYSIVGSNKVPFGAGGLVLDKLVLRDAPSKAFVVSVERRLVSPNLCYDLYDEGGGFVGKIER